MMETVLITGAARRLGRLIAEDLAKDGCHVWVHYLTHEEEARQLCLEIRKNGGQADRVRADLADIDQINRMLADIQNSEHGCLTALINNASVFPRGTIRQTAPDAWDRTMNINLKAVWYLSSRFAELFPTAGQIITIGDAGTGNLMPGHAVYALSKHALKFLTEQMAEAFAPAIRVNLLSPGLVLRGEGEPEEIWKKRREKSLLNNDAIADSVLDGIRFLMKNPGITGSELIVDNGSRFGTKLK